MIPRWLLTKISELEEYRESEDIEYYRIRVEDLENLHDEESNYD